MEQTGLKFSRYILSFQLADGTKVLANLLWRTYVELDIAETASCDDIKPLAKPHQLSEQLKVKLTASKILIDENLDESEFIAQRYQQTRFSPKVLGLTIAPTIDCNFSCGYCYEAKRPGKMSQETQDEIVEYARRNLAGRESFSVTWYGGEPLMCKEAVLYLSRRFIDLTEQNAVKYGAFMVTNGSLLKPKLVHQLAELGHWRNIQITIDGDRDAHNVKRPTKGGGPTFDVVLANLAYATDFLPMLLRMNVDLINPAACHDLLERLAGLGVSRKLRVYFSPIHPFGKGCRDIKEKEEIEVGTHSEFAPIETNLVRHAMELGFLTRDLFGGPWLQQCQAVSTHSIVIEPDGSLQRCWIEVGEDDKRVGHISQELEINSENNMRWLRFDPTRNDPCKSCEVLPLCFGGCPHRHVDGAPMEYTCKEIRFNVKERVILDFLSRYRPDQVQENLGPFRRATRRVIKIVPREQYKKEITRIQGGLHD